MIDRRAILFGASFTLLGASSFIVNPRPLTKPISEGEFQKLLPITVGKWKARKSSELILPAADALSDKLYENLQTLVYEGQNLPSIMFLIAYSSIQQNDVQVHRPEVCYPMAGFPIVANRPIIAAVENKKVPARFLIADRGSQKEMILYWTRVGQKYPLNWEQQRLEMARAGLSGIIPDGALIRFSMLAESETEALDTLTTFAGEMKNSLLKRATGIFFGPTSA